MFNGIGRDVNSYDYSSIRHAKETGQTKHLTKVLHEIYNKLGCVSSMYGLCELCHFIRINNYVSYILHSGKRHIFNFDSKILRFTRVIIQLLPS
jgi:hypothetical protein